LETRKFSGIGGSGEISVDIRIICATNRNLTKLVADGQFREDLFYRLNVIKIHVPALGERKGDIPALLSFYMQKFCDDNNLVSPKLSHPNGREISKSCEIFARAS
jgi:transcriptional regulator with PAS, ATPase and Fis domain